ncbi:anthranilate phosphoribosyltransferase [Tenuibacillus multivorans]|uniref:Anthranilate phosphoribosyltransferase n=1 Tax=Tenuibacillus multivorans TaxID=237069 RepID=A0A1H0B0G7_9BACI|nr:anthranilate phosphoribosyltransferase [Tenuibacillus multivorans]GEL77599.1 anthranilate phosphoribosyltransferase [Tenuibacillus multivorans]SDN38793.1 anthranilate phosphoribosyltransferase/anthranilate synthase/phosphoribosyltransferase [Tenuibacillus multivorans]
MKTSLLKKLTSGEQLRKEEMKEVAQALFDEDTSESKIASVLTALQVRGESADEVAAIVEVLREKAMPISKQITGVMDNCGTGGDGSSSFNISSTSAFVLAGAGAKIAKHGNRSVSSKTGSADVLEELGISLDFSSEEVEELLETNGIAFLFAPYVHPRLKSIMKVRQDLGVPTIFNIIGPLTNPVTLETQLLGVYRRDMLSKMADVLNQLGITRGIVVNGAGHMDEASLAGENHLVLLDQGDVQSFTLKPEDVGLTSYPNNAIRGGDAKENAEILLSVLNGEPGAYLDTVLLNAGLGLYSAGMADNIKEGIDKARESIESGRALEKLNHLIEYSKYRKKAMSS